MIFTGKKERAEHYNNIILKDIKNRPLEGIRIAIQDNYYIGGTRITLGSRSEFSRTYASKSETTDLVPLLEEVGATVIGKTICSALSIIDNPTQKGDYQIPLNPRGEEDSLIAGGSSGGSAAAVAAYDWLNLAICSDSKL
jgi:Asp-tRNA(Asn)/Glu-tRNA(Gln) amidotransferase A subunit family amidase